VAMVDGVSVAVPTDLHFDIVSEIIETGTHVLVEKPLTGNSVDGRRLVELAESKGVVLQVGHVENFNPVITYLRSKLTSPLFMEAHRLATFPPLRPGLKPRGTEVGVVHDLMIHDLDLILDLVDSPVVRVDAVGMPVLSPLEDIANARIVFENGCVANVTASRISPELMRKIRVFQPDTYISLDYGAQCGEIYARGPAGIAREEVPIESGNALQVELEDFIAGLIAFKETGKLPTMGVSGKRALSALELADEIVASLKTHIGGHEQLSSLIGPTGFLDSLNG
jgi:predicted dehydrogenase